MDLFGHPYRGATSAEEEACEQAYLAHCCSVVPDDALDYADMLLQKYGEFDSLELRYIWLEKEKRAHSKKE